jgi:hypothetical protein
VCNLDRTCYFCLPKEMLHPGSRFKMAGDLLETYLLWLTEAHALAAATWAAAPKTTSSYPCRTTIRNRKHGHSANRDCRLRRVFALVQRYRPLRQVGIV